MHIFVRYLALAPVVTITLAAPSRSQAARARFPLNSGDIVTTLEAAGLSVTASQLELPPSLSATSQDPALHLASAEVLADGRLRVRLLCKSNECLPFFVMVHLGARDAPLAEIAALNSSIRADAPIKEPNGPALRVGERTIFLMDDDHMRIALPVVSIDSGAVGSEVRVSSLDHKKIFHGIVLSSRAVQGNLP